VSLKTAVNYYIVERSADAKDWEALTSVVATYLTDVAKSYSYTDENPYTGISYFRLQQVDLSVEIFYSEIQEINNNAAFAAGVKVTNPFNNELQ
jgi:hypothetical protein